MNDGRKNRTGCSMSSTADNNIYRLHMENNRKGKNKQRKNRKQPGHSKYKKVHTWTVTKSLTDLTCCQH